MAWCLINQNKQTNKNKKTKTKMVPLRGKSVMGGLEFLIRFNDLGLHFRSSSSNIDAVFCNHDAKHFSSNKMKLHDNQ